MLRVVHAIVRLSSGNNNTLTHLFHLEDILLQLLTPVLTWIHYKRPRSNQPNLSTSAAILVVFALLHNPSYCPINQSEFCGRQRLQKWTNRGLYSRRTFPPSSSLLHCFFFFARILFLLPNPHPFIRLLRRLDILRLGTNFLWCVPLWRIENVWSLLAITASQRRNVLFDPYFWKLNHVM